MNFYLNENGIDMKDICGHKIRKKKCEMCGEKKPVIVILNPNRFPANDDNNRDDFWDVCNDCYKFVNWGMGIVPGMKGIDSIGEPLKLKRIKRLKATDHIATKRQKRYKNYGWETDKGRFKKWNGTCDCSMCKKQKHKDKGQGKAKQTEQKLG